MDPRYEKFAEVLVGYSVEVKKGEVVIVDTNEGTPIEMVQAIMRQVQKAGASAIALRSDPRLLREMLKNPDKRQLRMAGLGPLVQMTGANACIIIRDIMNHFELEDVPVENMKLYLKHWADPLLDERVEYSKWIVSRWPTQAMAQLAQMSTERYTDYFFKTVLLDYRKMARAAQPLLRLMEKTDKVYIKGPGTDLRFSIKGLPAVPCVGTRNIPDGEAYTAPVRKSVNGVITYNTMSVYLGGLVFEGISFTFKDGKIVKATCQRGDDKKLNEILDTDEGARYIGEFSFGFNPYITDTIGETLFDEKVAGSFHFTPGKAYDRCSNGNVSQIHWDLVLVQTEKKGGGEIYFDKKLIRKNGLFVPQSLRGLNPENLK